MKKFFILLATVLMTVVAGAQSTGNRVNTGIVRPVHAANWGRGVEGKISRYVFNSIHESGVYRVTVSGREYEISVLLVGEQEVSVLFDDGQYAARNRNWVDLRPSDKIWWFESTSWWIRNGDYQFLHEAFLADCGNKGTFRKPLKTITTKVVIERQVYKERLPLVEEKVSTTKQAPVAQELVELKNKQRAKRYHFRFPGGNCYQSYIEQGLYLPMWDEMASYGDRLTMAMAKRIVRRHLRGRERREVMRCITGKTWFGRNWAWVVPVGTAIVGGTIYALTHGHGDASPQGGDTPSTDPGYHPGSGD